MHQNTGEVLVRRQDNVSWITFSHPQHNSMPASQLSKLSTSLLEEGADTQTKVIVLQSAGDRTFCAGANFEELLSINTVEEGVDFFQGFARVILAIKNCGKIVVGRVQGKAVGGGVGLLASTDYCLATDEAAIRLSELSIGIGPYVIEPAITRKIGKAAFSQLALNPSEWQTARWAADRNLYQSLFPTSGQMDDYLLQYLEKMGSYSHGALSQMKSLLWEGVDHWEALLLKRAENSARLLLTDDTQRLIRSIVKR